jgi:hypothetical protein
LHHLRVICHRPNHVGDDGALNVLKCILKIGLGLNVSALELGKSSALTIALKLSACTITLHLCLRFLHSFLLH